MQEERNYELDLAWDYITRTSANVFLTGKAGTGKTTFLKKVVEDCPKRKVVLAPTGVAAINAGGVTLHSFFQLPFGIFLPEFQHVQAHDKEGRYKFHKKKRKIIRSMELMIIDEVSMLRADMMDELDLLLRTIRRNQRPFGGVQVLMIGDIQQLSPVVKEEEWEIMKKYYESPYFFDSKILKSTDYRLIELSKIYRQKDQEFIDILGAVRENRMTRDLLEKLNQRYVPNYEAPDGCITLCTHNFTAKNINDSRLKAIQNKEYSYTASIEGNFPENMYPQEVELILKKGAQVMFTKNDPSPAKEYVNGSLGVVVALEDESILVKMDDGGDINVPRVEWENIKYEINEETKEIVSSVDGLFIQYPLKTAWAITIHKSQGLTFDKAVIDASRSFSHGQVYVALSRCRTLEGMVLKEKIQPHSIIKDFRVDEFNHLVTDSLPSRQVLDSDCRQFFLQQIQSVFDLAELRMFYFTFLKFIRATAVDLYPKALESWTVSENSFREELISVSEKFVRSLDKVVGDDYQTSNLVQERVIKASAYFIDKVKTVLLPLCVISSKFEFDDQMKKKLYKQYFTNFTEAVFSKLLLWSYVSKGFRLDDLIKERSVLSVEIPELTIAKLVMLLNKAFEHPGLTYIELQKLPSVKSNEISMETDSSEKEAYEDIKNEDLFNRLKEWRSAQAKEQSLPAFMILHQRTLISIANSAPSTEAELLAIKGVGKSFIQKYATQVLELITGESSINLFSED